MRTLDIAVVATCHNYGMYLEEWARSIVGQEGYRPAVVCVVDNGSTDSTPADIEATRPIIEGAGIPFVTERIPYSNHGVGRNRAIALSGEIVATEWVTHFDCDDEMMPHFLADVADLMPEADVVGCGYERSGNRAAGPRNRKRIYSEHQGEDTRQSGAPCSGVSPFRRRLWALSPYREDMRGGWDTALWIGFSWLNARFVPTPRPVFHYRQHADSIFNTRRISRRKSRLVGVKLGNLRRPIEGVSVVIPFAGDDEHRKAALDYSLARYAALHPDWEVTVSDDPTDGPWCKGAAVMAGIVESKGVTTVIADADCLVHPDALTEAVRLVSTLEASWVIPHEHVHRLTREATADVYERVEPGTHVLPVEPCGRAPYVGFAGGGILVVDRSDYEATGGIPPQFVGWGCEDEALAVILSTIVGPPVRLGYDLTHLWHPSARAAGKKQYVKNRELFKLISALADDPDGMWEVNQHLCAGGAIEDINTWRRDGQIIMRCIVTHQRGNETIKVGDLFRVTEDEARRHEARPAQLARRLNGSSFEVRRPLARTG